MGFLIASLFPNSIQGIIYLGSYFYCLTNNKYMKKSQFFA